ncbi:MAG: NUDIX hydrolase [Bdellovibrionales bacterium]
MPRTLWEILETDTALDTPHFKVTRERVRLPSGKIDDVYLQKAAHWVAVLALTADGHILTLNEYRHGTRTYMRHIPAGHIDEGEDPLQAAQRELMEEAGHEADNWEHVGDFHANASRTATTATLFVARNARPAGQQRLTDFEAIEVVPMTPAILLQHLASSEGNDLPHTALMYIGLHKLGLIK